MAIKTRNKRSLEFSSASMSDLVFLLLIFFMITSTLVSPNAVKLLLPQSNSKTMAKQNVTVYIQEPNLFYIGETPIEIDQLETKLGEELVKEAQVDATVVLRADRLVAVQDIILVIDAINAINDNTGNKYKLILATTPKE
ncbi:MAG: biopolymer transporter ExbD [Bacteroidales bacterium]|nr:biopolymer transporter ExbD [Bacteroidales bacterium]MDY0216910.1 biopolymer transporter ExbD [Bacteroidales bacterium]